MSCATRAAKRPASASFSDRTSASCDLSSRSSMSLNASASAPISFVARPRCAAVESLGDSSRTKRTRRSSGAVTRRTTAWLTSTMTSTLAAATSRIVRATARVADVSAERFGQERHRVARPALDRRARRRGRAAPQSMGRTVPPLARLRAAAAVTARRAAARRAQGDRQRSCAATWPSLVERHDVGADDFLEVAQDGRVERQVAAADDGGRAQELGWRRDCSALDVTDSATSAAAAVATSATIANGMTMRCWSRRPAQPSTADRLRSRRCGWRTRFDARPG